MDERLIDQQDPALETIGEPQRSLTATLGYFMGRASLAELFALQAYLSQLVARMLDSDQSARIHRGLAGQVSERQWQEALQSLGPASANVAQYRQEG